MRSEGGFDKNNKIIIPKCQPNTTKGLYQTQPNTRRFSSKCTILSLEATAFCSRTQRKDSPNPALKSLNFRSHSRRLRHPSAAEPAWRTSSTGSSPSAPSSYPWISRPESPARSSISHPRSTRSSRQRPWTLCTGWVQILVPDPWIYRRRTKP